MSNETDYELDIDFEKDIKEMIKSLKDCSFQLFSMIMSTLLFIYILLIYHKLNNL